MCCIPFVLINCVSYVLRHSLAVVAWSFSGNPEQRKRDCALKLAHKSAHAGSAYGHFVLYQILRDGKKPRAIRQLELACSTDDRNNFMLGCSCFLCAPMKKPACVNLILNLCV